MIKKALVLTVALVLIPFLGTSQNLRIAPELGGNLIPIVKDDLGIDYQLGHHHGIAVEYGFNKSFGIRSGIYFTQKNQFTINADTGTLNLFGLEDQLGPLADVLDFSVFERKERQIKQYYLEIPLLGTYQYEKFRAFLGPYASYMVFARSSELTITDTPVLEAVDFSTFDPTGFISNLLPNSHTENVVLSRSKNGLNTFDFGIKAGIGVETDNFGANIFYSYGLNQFRTNSILDRKTHNYLQFSVNYFFEVWRRR